MAGSPPPPKPNVLPFERPRRTDETQAFETHGKRKDDTERMEVVITDEGPPTEKIEVPPPVKVPRPQIKTFSPPLGDKWDLFSVNRVPAGKKLASLYEPITTAYAILEGEAEERALDRDMNLHRVRTLTAGCLVNPCLFDEARAHNQSSVEVIATTEMIIYAIAIDDLEANDVPEDRRTGIRIKRDRYVRSLLARESDPSLSGRNHFFERVKALDQLLKSDLELRIKEVSEKSIGPTRRENAVLKAWLEMFFAHNVPELLEEVWRLKKDHKNLEELVKNQGEEIDELFLERDGLYDAMRDGLVRVIEESRLPKTVAVELLGDIDQMYRKLVRRKLPNI